MKKRGAGSISSRNGARWTRSGADTRKRGEAVLLARGPEGQFGRVLPMSEQAVRRAIEAQVCPWCAQGPYKVLAGHTHKAHGVDRHELRRLAGKSARESICSPDASVAARGRLTSRGDFAEMSSRGGTAAIQAGAAAAANAAWRRVSAERNSDRDALIVRLYRLDKSLNEIAAEANVSAGHISSILKRRGVHDDFRKRRARTQAPDERRRQTVLMVQGTKARLEKIKQARLARFAELGSGWPAVQALSVEWEVSQKSVVAWLKGAGATVPDGRAANPHRGPRPDLRKEPVACTTDGCTEKATRRAMCNRHYRRVMRAAVSSELLP